MQQLSLTVNGFQRVKVRTSRQPHRLPRGIFMGLFATVSPSEHLSPSTCATHFPTKNSNSCSRPKA
jgi:hypothetical protein